MPRIHCSYLDEKKARGKVVYSVRVLGVKDVIIFSGASIKELRQAFSDSIETIIADRKKAITES